jgi:hypothetical protein
MNAEPQKAKPKRPFKLPGSRYVSLSVLLLALRPYSDADMMMSDHPLTRRMHTRRASTTAYIEMTPTAVHPARAIAATVLLMTMSLQSRVMREETVLGIWIAVSPVLTMRLARKWRETRRRMERRMMEWRR